MTRVTSARRTYTFRPVGALILFLGLVCSTLSLAKSPVSAKALKTAEKPPLADVQYLSAEDGQPLAFRRYLPRQVESLLILYHAPGLHSAVGYPALAFELAKSHEVGVYLPDLRGHGKSGGERGDAPSVDTFWEDLDTVIDYVAMHHPDKVIYLGAHGATAGLILNYVSEFPRAPVEALTFIAPDLGTSAELRRRHEPPFMVSGNLTSGIYNKATLGLLCRHCTAARLNYPHRLKVGYPGVVTELSYTTLKAMTPSDPVMQVRRLRIPFTVWSGSKDELINAARTKMFFKKNGREPWLSKNALLKGESHLSVLLNLADEMGNWIQLENQTRVTANETK